MSNAVAISSIRPSGTFRFGEPSSLVVMVDVQGELVFDPDILVEAYAAGASEASYSHRLKQQRTDLSWLPRGRYEASWATPAAALSAGSWRFRVAVFAREASKDHLLAETQLDVSISGTGTPREMSGHWHLQSMGDTPQLSSLAWAQGHSSWFYKHFDHAAKVVINYMFCDSPLLRGRILDVGCGDGITDLGIALRQKPELLIGADPFRGYERLPAILQDSGLGHVSLPDCLKFEPVDANFLPYADDSFDVVISWGSLEHIVGGYLQPLREIKRVLRPDGLFFVHPGLYYSNWGHHLGEFCKEPFFHLTMSHDALRELVLNTEPKYMDRSGEFATAEQYWRWFNELNRITVPQVEAELRAMEFDLWRVALRTEDLIEYTAPLRAYPMQDLATAEVYLSCVNRKKQRPA